MKKNKLSIEDIKEIVSKYDIGEYKKHSFFTEGSVQINICIETSEGKYALKYYRNRNYEEVSLEVEYLNYLHENDFISPCPIPNKTREYAGVFEENPYVLFNYIEGKHIENLEKIHKKEMIKEIAKLHLITENKVLFSGKRNNYSVEFCDKRASLEADLIGTENSKKKLEWIKSELKKIDISENISKGICHCDFHHTNFLFKKDKLEAILDFDDANYTYLIYDLVNFIDYWSWRTEKELDFDLARDLIAGYDKIRKLSEDEKINFFKVFKLQVLIDTIWFMKREKYPDFFEKRKFEYLEKIEAEGMKKIFN
jgi:Ser/Thr protein kinase RdoA (MazF antagonist)